MADSNITKRALSSALKELMQEKPFQKISVADICERCCMNRQSFYYHFKDKYDLLIWIFDTDFLSLIRKQQEEKALDIVSQICRVMYKNRVFYRAAFAVQGQNSLTEHLREVAEPILQMRMRAAMPGKEVSAFHINFMTDAILAALLRWIGDDNCMPPEEFMHELSFCVLTMANHVLPVYTQ